MAPAAPRLSAEGLVIARQGRRLLDGASIDLEAGAIAAIEGSSGSGKTTLLRALATLIPLDAGRLVLEGEDASAISPMVYRRRVALVPQQPPMLEGSVAHNIATGPRLRGAAIADDEIAKLLDRVGLPGDFGDREARDLSGGERQRVALARALANEPCALLLDEPTAALDPASAARVLSLVRALAGEGLAIAVVTHIEDHARDLGGSRYRCEHGRVIRAEAA